MGWDTLRKTSDDHLGNNLGQVEHQPRDVTTEVDLKHHDDNDGHHRQMTIGHNEDFGEDGHDHRDFHCNDIMICFTL